MAQRKPSFFERLTGSIRMTDDDLDFIPEAKNSPRSFRDDDDYITEHHSTLHSLALDSDPVYEPNTLDENHEEIAELAVDVYGDTGHIYIQTMAAGIKKEDLDIKISREQVIICGSREPLPTSYDKEYFSRELYWGAFERIINLPDEIDIEQAKATELHGLITITLPKFDKKRQTKLRIS